MQTVNYVLILLFEFELYRNHFELSMGFEFLRTMIVLFAVFDLIHAWIVMLPQVNQVYCEINIDWNFEENKYNLFAIFSIVIIIFAWIALFFLFFARVVQLKYGLSQISDTIKTLETKTESTKKGSMNKNETTKKKKILIGKQSMAISSMKKKQKNVMRMKDDFHRWFLLSLFVNIGHLLSMISMFLLSMETNDSNKKQEMFHALKEATIAAVALINAKLVSLMLEYNTKLNVHLYMNFDYFFYTVCNFVFASIYVLY